jgi:16S rRNA (uracil1498-N3)-methyltransferase
MSLPRFFIDDLQPGIVTLSQREGRHLQHARRLHPGDEVVLFNGRGDEGFGALSATAGSRKGPLEVEIRALRHRPRPIPHLTLAVALPKGPRQDWLIEKCTELGVAAIQPIITRRSIAQASAHRLTRWRQTAIEAAKQSGQAWLPELLDPLDFPDALARASGQTHVLIASATARASASSLPGTERVIVFIGPEGDWTPDELRIAELSGAGMLSLGPNTLRVETAAVAVAAIVHAGLRTGS